MLPSTDTGVAQPVQGGVSALSSIQAPVRSELDQVGSELRRIVLSDFDMIEEVNEHLLFLQGKLFRPTLLLLSSRVRGEPHDDSRTLAAVVDLHSTLPPTLRCLWRPSVDLP